MVKYCIYFLTFLKPFIGPTRLGAVPVCRLQVYGASASVGDWGRWPPPLVWPFRYPQLSLEYSWVLEGATERKNISIMMPEFQDLRM